MAGHSKWANIQHRKKRQDAKRGKLFTKLIREVSIAARIGGPDPDANFRLRGAMDKAMGGNVPKDTIDRAIKKAAGDAELSNIEEVRYEGYGPGGIAVMVDCMTNNRNRTVAEIRHVFSKCGGNLGTDGSVSYLFDKVGQLSFASGANEEELMDLSLEAGADDIASNEDGSVEVLTGAEQFEGVKTALLAAGEQPEQAEITMRASTSVTVEEDDAEKVSRLLDMLEDLDDVQEVYSNAEFTEAALASLGG